jgi:cysteine desulfurase
VGLAEAARRSASLLTGERARLLRIREELEVTVAKDIPGSRVNGEGMERTPNTVNFRFDEVDGEDLLRRLDREGFAVSTGAACSAGAVAPSHVLLAMGLAPSEVQGSIRVSFGRTTRAEEVRAFAAALKGAVQEARVSTQNAVSQVRLSR